jgi:hypothetical protein
VKRVLFSILLPALLVLPGCYGGDPELVAAGDIACESPPLIAGPECRYGQTAQLVEILDPDRVAALGDLQYEDGVAWSGYYHPHWARFKAKTRPAVGNHEYHTPGAAGYFDYWNGVGSTNGPAGPRGKGYYSYVLGSSRLLALNSEIGDDAAQREFVRTALVNASQPCILAYWHRPVFTSGTHHRGSGNHMKPVYDLLRFFGADVVLGGHEHSYERFATQNSAGRADVKGIRQFVVGTGGKSLYSMGLPVANSQFRYAADFGVLRLKLHPSSYSWEARRLDGSVVDSGSTNCN